MLCPSCNETVRDVERFCRYCGATLSAEKQVAPVPPPPEPVAQVAAPVSAEPQKAEPQKAVCPSCGADVIAGTKFCRYCGATLTAEKQAAPVPPSPEAAAPVPAEPLKAGPQKAVCPSCGADVIAGTKFCRKCGAALNAEKQTALVPPPPEPVAQAAVPVPAEPQKAEPQKAVCPSCGADVIAGTKFCRKCGAAVKTAAVSPAPVAVAPVPVVAPAPQPAYNIGAPRKRVARGSVPCPYCRATLPAESVKAIDHFIGKCPRVFKCAGCGEKVLEDKKWDDPTYRAKEEAKDAKRLAEAVAEAALTSQQREERALKAGEAAKKAAIIELLIDLSIIGLIITRLMSQNTNAKFKTAEELTPWGFVNTPLEEARKIKKVGWAIYIIELIVLAIIYFAL